MDIIRDEKRRNARLQDFFWSPCDRNEEIARQGLAPLTLKGLVPERDEVKSFWVCSKERCEPGREDVPWLKELPQRGLSIVGTRMPSHGSLQMVQNVLRDLASTDVIVVSGLAFGIDAQVHRTALALGLPSVAILAGGFEHLYPSQHLELACDLVERGGILISEHPPSRPARRHDFLRRNRLIAGWCKALWMVEAPFKSGAMNSAHWAHAMGRDLYVTPAHPEDAALAGNVLLLKQNKAVPLYDAYGLAGTWPLLASMQVNDRPDAPPQATWPRQVLQEIQRESSRYGSVTLWDLRAWCFQVGRRHEELSEAIQELERSRHITRDAQALRPC